MPQQNEGEHILMKTWIIIIGCYIAISVVLYFAMRCRCKANAVFKMPKSKFVYYFLSFTWGLPMTLFGCLVALVLRMCGKKPIKYGWDWYFEFDDIDWGLELGIFFISPRGNYISLKNHEHGHGIQNIYLGIFAPLVVSLPSVTRFWYREFRSSVLKLRNKTAYSDIWFEDSADKSGTAFINSLKEKDNE